MASVETEQTESATAKYPVGTSFLKKFTGYGVWEGRITSFDGDTYAVMYPEDEYVESFSCSAMDEVMEKSNKLIEKKVEVANQESARQTIGACGQSNVESFEIGQHVWVDRGKIKQPGKIQSIKKESGKGSSAIAKIKWLISKTLEDVGMHLLLPMFDMGENGERITSTHSKRKRKQTDAYTPPSQFTKVEDEMGHRSDNTKEKEEMGKMSKTTKVTEGTGSNTKTAKDEEPSRGAESNAMSEASVLGSSQTTESELKSYYNHEGFQFTQRKPCCGETEDIYWCSNRLSADCPVELKLNNRGIAGTYTSNGEPAFHTYECKRKKRKMNSTKQSKARKDPPESREVAANIRKQFLSKKKQQRGEKKEAALRGWEKRRKGEAVSSLGKGGAIEQPEQGHCEDATHLNTLTGKSSESEPLQQGQAGATHLNTCTHQFKEGQNVWVCFGKAQHAAVIDSIFNESKEGEPQMARVKWSVMNTLDEVEVDQLLPMHDDVNGGTVSSSFSKRERRQTNLFSPPPPPLHGKKAKSQDQMLPKKVNPGGQSAKKVSIVAVTKDSIKKRHASFIHENLNTLKQVPSGVAPGPGWRKMTAKPLTGREGLCWVSPGKGIIFKFPRVAFEFEEVRQQCDGDEDQALVLYRQKRRAAGQQTFIVNRPLRCNGDEEQALALHKQKRKAAGQNYEITGNPDSVWENWNTVRKIPSCIAPGPGWRKVKRRDGDKIRTHWISPSKGIVFKFPRVAFEFEELRKQCNFDEEQALALYKQKQQAAGQQTYILNMGTSSRRWKRVTNETGVSKRLDSDPDMEEDTDSDSEEGSGSDREMEEDTYSRSDMEEAIVPSDDHESMTIAEIENDYNSLWDYYMKPIFRENEELGSGMILRKKKAQCNLLRYKNSVFRQKLHRKILSLEKNGKKDEIHRMLRNMKEFDSSPLQSGDGPITLMDEILGPRTYDDDIEVLDTSAVAELQEHDGNDLVGPSNITEATENGLLRSTEMLADPEHPDGASKRSKDDLLAARDTSHFDLPASTASSDFTAGQQEFTVQSQEESCSSLSFSEASAKISDISVETTSEVQVIDLFDDDGSDTNTAKKLSHRDQTSAGKPEGAFTAESNNSTTFQPRVEHHLESSPKLGNVIDLCDDDELVSQNTETNASHKSVAEVSNDSSDMHQAVLDQYEIDKNDEQASAVETALLDWVDKEIASGSSATNNRANRDVEDISRDTTSYRRKQNTEVIDLSNEDSSPASDEVIVID